MNDLGLDSLDQVEVIMAMEDEFGEFTDDLHLVSTSLTHTICNDNRTWRQPWSFWVQCI